MIEKKMNRKNKIQNKMIKSSIENSPGPKTKMRFFPYFLLRTVTKVELR